MQVCFQFYEGNLFQPRGVVRILCLGEAALNRDLFCSSKIVLVKTICMKGQKKGRGKPQRIQVRRALRADEVCG